jgi:hypothetical protein
MLRIVLVVTQGIFILIPVNIAISQQSGQSNMFCGSLIYSRQSTPGIRSLIIGSAGRNGRTGMVRELQIHLDPAVLKTSSPMSGTNVLFIIELLRTSGLHPP